MYIVNELNFHSLKSCNTAAYLSRGETVRLKEKGVLISSITFCHG